MKSKNPLDKLLFSVCFASVIFCSITSCEKDRDEKTVTDIDGNVYNTVTIGSQVWLKENLMATRLNDGTDIQYVTNNQTWSGMTTPGYCWLDNDESTYKDTYGALYNYYAVATNKLCPSGWHVPSDEEWKQLEMFAGMDQAEADIQGDHRGTDEGGKLKEKGTAHWASPNSGATDEFNFTALPGGWRSGTTGALGAPGQGGDFWSSTQIDANGAYDRGLRYDKTDISRNYEIKTMGYSVRCIKN